jgi:hypothetical protein
MLVVCQGLLSGGRAPRCAATNQENFNLAPLRYNKVTTVINEKRRKQWIDRRVKCNIRGWSAATHHCRDPHAHRWAFAAAAVEGSVNNNPPGEAARGRTNRPPVSFLFGQRGLPRE